jgi:hypothetical protein
MLPERASSGGLRRWRPVIESVAALQFVAGMSRAGAQKYA